MTTSKLFAQTMERSTTFTAVSGWGYCAMGATRADRNSHCPTPGHNRSLAGGVARRKRWLPSRWRWSRCTGRPPRLGTPILSIPGRRLFVGLLPALFAGGVMTVALVAGQRSPADSRSVAVAVWRGRDAGGSILREDNPGDGSGVRAGRSDRVAVAVVLGECHAGRRIRAGAYRLRRIDREEAWWLSKQPIHPRRAAVRIRPSKKTPRAARPSSNSIP